MDQITVSREKLRQVLDALDGQEASPSEWDAYCKLREALELPVQEPVAWLYDFTIINDDEVYTNWVTQDPTEVGKEVEGISNVRPLYAAPQAQPAVEPYAWVYVNKYGVDSVPAAREWCESMVSGHGGSMFPLYTAPQAQQQPQLLTDAEIEKLQYEHVGVTKWFPNLARAIEQAVLKKNGVVK